MSEMLTLVHASDDDLVLYFQGLLVPEFHSVTEQHLSDCEICRGRLSRSIGSKLIPRLKETVKAVEKRERSEPRFSTGSEATVQKLSPLSLDRQRVKIVDISKNGLGIQAPVAVLPETIVQIRINTSVELGEVRHCSASGDNGYRIGLRFMVVADRNVEHVVTHQGAILAAALPIPLRPQSDRRQTPRQQLSRSAVVSVLGTGQRLQGEIRDISEGGIQMRLDEPIRISSLAKIEYDDRLLLGEVRYCRQEKTGWILGLRVEHALLGVTDLVAAMRHAH